MINGLPTSQTLNDTHYNQTKPVNQDANSNLQAIQTLPADQPSQKVTHQSSNLAQPAANDTNLNNIGEPVDTTQTFNETFEDENGITQSGTFTFIPQLNDFCLTLGEINYPKTDDFQGYQELGRFEYSAEANSMVLVKGQISCDDSFILEGSFKYVPELKNIVLTQGCASFPQTDQYIAHTQEGTFDIDLKSQSVFLKSGKVSDLEGFTSEGQFGTIESTNEIYLTNGTHSWANGLETKGHFEYSKKSDTIYFTGLEITPEKKKLNHSHSIWMEFIAAGKNKVA